MVLSPSNGLSLCAGGGGLDMGLMLAEPDFHTRCFVEWDEYPRSTLIAAMDNGYFEPAPIWDDVTTFDGKPFRGAFDTILAGYPCQPFSQAGQRKGADDERHLWPDIARIIREVRPAWVILENVAGHVTLGAETVLRELHDMGFEVAVGLFTAAETGAPHKRERWFCVAYSDSNAQLANSRRPNAGSDGRNYVGRSGRNTVDNAERFGRVEGRDRDNGRDVRQQLDAEGCPMAYTKSPDRGSEQQSRSKGRRRAGLARERRELANTCSEGLQGRERNGASGTQESPNRHIAKRCNAVAHTISDAGHKGRHRKGCGASSERQTDCLGTRRPNLYPPAPSSGEWAATIDHAPNLAPATSFGDCVRFARHLAQMVAAGELAETEAERRICRMVDGLATRSRALKLLGNGVHPLGAANAIRTLLDAHGLGRVDMEATSQGN